MCGQALSQTLWSTICAKEDVQARIAAKEDQIMAEAEALNEAALAAAEEA